MALRRSHGFKVVILPEKDRHLKDLICNLIEQLSDMKLKYHRDAEEGSVLLLSTSHQYIQFSTPRRD